ncbi:MAG: hypothetical protein LC118_20115 [Dehalococcoidia bacterium]|nr:hypothetical protein [Dehalococcoidia bacterium]
MTDAHAQAHDPHDTHHAPADPNAAPMHQEVRFDFPQTALWFAWGLGAVAMILGVVLGLAANN